MAQQLPDAAGKWIEGRTSFLETECSISFTTTIQVIVISHTASNIQTNIIHAYVLVVRILFQSSFCVVSNVYFGKNKNRFDSLSIVKSRSSEISLSIFFHTMLGARSRLFSAIRKTISSSYKSNKGMPQRVLSSDAGKQDLPDEYAGLQCMYCGETSCVYMHARALTYLTWIIFMLSIC